MLAWQLVASAGLKTLSRAGLAGLARRLKPRNQPIVTSGGG